MRETARARHAFDLYVRQPLPRSLEVLRNTIAADPEAYGFRRAPSLRSLYRWSPEFHWQDRLRDLEREARVRDAEEHVAALREMNERHTQEGLALQQKAVQRLQAAGPKELSLTDTIRALGEGVRIERLARGEATARLQLEKTTSNELEGFSIAELRAIAASLGGRTPGDRGSQPEQPAGLGAGQPDDPEASAGADAGAR